MAQATARRRLVPSILAEVAAAKDLKLTSFSHGWVHILSCPATGKLIRVRNSVFPVNKTVSSKLADDKAAAATILEHFGVPCVPATLAPSATPSREQHRLSQLEPTG